MVSLFTINYKGWICDNWHGCFFLTIYLTIQTISLKIWKSIIKIRICVKNTDHLNKNEINNTYNIQTNIIIISNKHIYIYQCWAMINRIQNKSCYVHNMCVCTVYIYYVYINTHTCMCIFKKNKLCLYIKYILYNINYININIYM